MVGPQGSMPPETNEIDVIVVGAGISGISAGFHLQQQCPDHSYVILEGRSCLGGTWDLFRYPGIRSDSDMHTLGFSFQRWDGSKSIADGASILAYLRQTASDHGIDHNIRFDQHVSDATWSSQENRWTVRSECKKTGRQLAWRGRFLFICAGYYSYAGGYRPDFPTLSSFKGEIVDPQHWPDDLDYAGKQIVVIGSGATAVTLVPAMARKAAHVTMLQRSPSYVVAMPDRDAIADWLRQYLPARLAYRLIRWKNIKISEFFYKRTRTKPEKVRKFILGRIQKTLGDVVDIDTHFNPKYGPWDQRLCLIPNGDLFKVLRDGQASIKTEQIDRFIETGIRLASGATLEADIIITATGLNVVAVGGIDLKVDNRPVNLAERWTYKGVAYSDIPNMVATFGYINASWTLRAEMVSQYVCRLLNHMRKTGLNVAVPRLRPVDRNMVKRPLIEEFSSGYIQRALPSLPRQGDRAPWVCPQNYTLDRKALIKRPIEDGVMTFTRDFVGDRRRDEVAAGAGRPG